ncbi:MAG TPA: hypothetical protein PLL77_08590 [Pyrinomonadaceae bacterium]|nr:hypothetical protein [Pyrinomonadaceae bacterium]
MSKKTRAILQISAVFVLILQFFTFALAQDVEVRFRFLPDVPTTVEVEGKYESNRPRKNPRNFSLMTEYAGVTGLVERVSNIGFADRNGKTLTNKRFNPGEYVADGDIILFRYFVDIKPLTQRSAAAHVSWINGDAGLLMLDDLMPQSGGEKISANVKIDLPVGWKIFSTARLTSEGFFEVNNVEKASFVIGKNWREVNAGALKILISGQWQFTDDEALKMAVEIFGGYAKTFGSSASPATQIAIFKFPGDVPLGNWEADTRGGSVTIASSDMPFRSQSVQRLHEQLRHEIFHLWIPNGVNFSGKYDWFYEGFALYQSLKLGVAVNRLRFDDYLDTLSRAIVIDNFGSQRRSLIDASNYRWNGSDTQVYARGMLAAFICDLALLDKSKGKVSTDTLVAEIYQKHYSGADRTDGTAAILSIMRSHPELVPVIDRIITGADKFEWPALLSAAGIEVVTANSTSALRVIAKPSGRQKDLLDKLGYNNWRKSTGNNR